MLTLIILFVLLLIPYSVPGLFLARGIYSEQVREIRSKPVTVIPPRPKRPDIRLSEMLHTSAPSRCALLKNDALSPARFSACTCKYRDDWIKLKNDWIDYEEWERKYGRLSNGVAKMPEPDMSKVYLAVPFWPVVMMGMFIKGGADNIPDFREIERLERSVGIDPLELN